MGATEIGKRDCTDGGDRNSPFSNKCIPTGTVVPAATASARFFVSSRALPLSRFSLAIHPLIPLDSFHVRIKMQFL